MKLERALQKKILEVLSQHYPDAVGLLDLRKETVGADADHQASKHFRANLIYLEQHGLARNIPPIDDCDNGGSVITKDGMDFLADDGGLSAILGVVTIKLHDDQVRLMLASRIQESNSPEAEKRKWLGQLREIPADATKHLVHRLIDAGLAQWPTVLAAMQTLTK